MRKAKLKELLLASAFVVAIGTSGQALAVTIQDSDPGANGTNLSGELSGTITAGEVSGGVGGVIADNTIVHEDIDAGAVRSTEILDGTIALIDMSNNSVDSSKIVDGSITSADIAPNTITEANLAAGSVSGGVGGTITDESITGADIQDGSVGLVDLSASVQSQITGNTAAIGQIREDIQDLKGGVAMGLAMANVPGVPRGKQFALGVGAGIYDGESAGAIKFSMAPKRFKKIQLNASVGYASDTVGAGVGVSYGF